MVVEGAVKTTTDLLALPFDHIFYTGSTFVGKIVMKAAAVHLATVTLELGGCNPCFVDDSIDLKVAAKRIAWLKTNNSGQLCLSVNYLFIKTELLEPFLKYFEEALVEMYGTDIRNCADYPRIIHTNHFNRISTILNSVDKENVLLGGQSDSSDLFIPPIVVKASLTDKIISEELFAPILPIIPVDNFDKAVSFASKSKPLCSYVFSNDKQFQENVIQNIISGTTMVNDVLMNMSYSTLPFGGCGMSGQGGYHGKFGFDEFSHSRAILIRTMIDEPIMELRYPPLTKLKLKWLNILS